MNQKIMMQALLAGRILVGPSKQTIRIKDGCLVDTAKKPCTLPLTVDGWSIEQPQTKKGAT